MSLRSLIYGTAGLGAGVFGVYNIATYLQNQNDVFLYNTVGFSVLAAVLLHAAKRTSALEVRVQGLLPKISRSSKV